VRSRGRLRQWESATVNSVNHLAIPVSDQARSQRFYESYFAFGARPARRYEDGVLMLYSSQEFALALGPHEPGPPPAWMHFGLGLPSREAVRKLRDRLVQDGVELVDSTEEPAYVSVKCRDPDGYIVEGFWEPEGELSEAADRA
jgi:catechol 2,3-dioxygenase-like lactoylglutathione lyase family enzyme